jgi:hypothetical protein
MADRLRDSWSGREDLNLRPPAPHEHSPSTAKKSASRGVRKVDQVIVLDQRDYGHWFRGSDDPKELLKACHNEALYNYPVSRQVNSVRSNDASLVVPVDHSTIS